MEELKSQRGYLRIRQVFIFDTQKLEDLLYWSAIEENSLGCDLHSSEISRI